MKKKRILRFPLAGPLERRPPGGLSNHQVEAPKVELVENQYRSRSAEWAKRPGFVAETQNAQPIRARGAARSLSVVRKLGQANNSPIAVGRMEGGSQNTDAAFTLIGGQWNSANAHGYSPAWAVRVADVDMLSSIVPVSQPCITSDVASNGTIAVVASSMSTTAGSAAPQVTQLNFLDSNLNNLNIGVDTVDASGAIDPRVVFTAGSFFLFWVKPSGASSTLVVLKFSDESAGSLLPGSVVNVATDLMGTGTGQAYYDVQVRVDTGRILIAYRSSSSTLKVMEWNPTTNVASVAAITIGAGDLAAKALGWVRHDFTAGSVFLVTARNDASDGVRLRVLNTSTLAQSSSLLLQASPGDVASITSKRNNGANAFVTLWEVRGASGTDTTLSNAEHTSTSLTGVTSDWLRGVSLASSLALAPDGTWVFLASSADDLQPAYYLFSLGGFPGDLYFNPPVVAGALRGRGQGLHPRRSHLSNLFSFGPTAGPNGISIGGGLLVGARRVVGVAFDAATTQKIRYAQTPLYFRNNLDYIPSCRVGKGLLFGSAAPMFLAGGAAFPAGFIIDPPKFSVTTPTAGALAAGTYGLACRFKMTDEFGNVWRSAPSPPVFTAVLANTFPQGLLHTMGQNSDAVRTLGAEIEWYRTKKDGTVFYLQPSTNTEYRTDINPQSSPGGGVGEGAIPDDVLEQNLILDANLGELIPGPCPPMIDCVAVGDRVVVIPSEYPTAVAASKATVLGNGLGFHPDLLVNLLSDGPNTALAEMDGRTIVFKRQAIYVLTGDWPANNGTGTLPVAQKVATGLGTADPASVAITREGVWFKDPAKGISLLDRSLQIRQPGKLVDLYNGNEIAGAAAAEAFDQVRFVTSSTANATQGFAALMYDQVEGHWSHAGYCWGSSGAGDTPTCAALINGTFYVGTAGGKVYREDTSIFTDGGVSYPVRTQLRLPFSGGGAVVRVHGVSVLGLLHEEVDLAGTLYSDYGGVGSRKTDPQTVHISQQDPGESLPAAFEEQFRPRYQRCESMLLDLTYTSAGQGLRFRALALEIGVQGALQTARRVPGRQRSDG